MNSIKDCKILLIDDERPLLQMVETILRAEGYGRIYLAHSAADAVRQFEAINPHCAIIDIMLPDGNGFDLLKIFRRTSTLPVLFLSACDEDENRLLGLGLGADDYLTKPFLPRELTLRLANILTRVYCPPQQVPMAKAVFYLGQRKIDFNSGSITGENFSATLTAKEYALLEKLYANRGHIVTSDSLCQAAWNDGFFGYENTLMVHIRRLREKIEPEPSAPRYLLTVRGLGYKLVVGDEE